MKNFFDRSSSEEREVASCLLSGQDSSVHEPCCNLADFLEQAALGDIPVRANISSGSDTFILFATKVDEPTRVSLAEAARILTHFVAEESSPSISVFYQLHGTEETDSVTCLATLNRSKSAFAESLCWPAVSVLDAELPVETREKARYAIPWFSPRRRTWKISHLQKVALWSALAALALALILLYYGGYNVPFRQHFENGIWVRYDLKGSTGPRYQLQFSRHNVSDWENPYPDGEWAVRIDDQAIIPASLMDEEELRYQAWFRNRYPEMRAVVDQQDYLSQEFLSDPDRIKVPADWLFHPAHCIVALRRYWKAKETGQHVCPRDIDHKHIHHCLDSLDEWFFIGGEMRKPPPQPVDYEAKWSLVWKTKVCW